VTTAETTIGKRSAGLVFGALAVALVAAPPRAGAQDAQLLIDVATTADAAGADTREALAQSSGELRAAQQRALPVTLAAGRCLLAAARSGGALENVDVEVLRGRTVLSRDTDTGHEATARYCAAARPERLSVRVRAFRGAGPFALGVYLLPEGATAAVAVVALTSAGLLDRLAERVRASGAGMSPVTAEAREVLVAGQRVERDVSIVPGRCYRVLVAAEDGVTDVDLALRAPDARGDESLQTDGTREPTASLGLLRPLCPPSPGTYRLAITLVSGTGAIAWQVLGSSATAPAETAAARVTFPIGGAGTTFVAQRVRARHTAVGEGRAPVSDLFAGQLRTNEAADHEVLVDAGKCYVVLGAGAPSVAELDLVVRDSLGNELARDAERDAFPRVHFCPLTSARVRVSARMYRGYGPYGVQVFGGPR
jgi:hypothetical protein